MAKFFINKTKIITLSMFFIFLFTQTTIFAANTTNENTADINIIATDNEIKVSEKWKLVLDDNSFKRNINVNINEIHSVIAQLIYPTSIGLDSSLKEVNNGTDIQITLPKLKSKEIIVTLEYSLNTNKSILKSLENNEEYNLLYPGTGANVKTARIDINVESEILGVDTRKKSYTDNTEIQPKATQEEKKTTTKSNVVNNDEKIVSKNKSTKSIFSTIKSILFDLFILIVCTLVIALTAFLSFVGYNKYIDRRKRKFNKRKKNYKKRIKRRFR